MTYEEAIKTNYEIAIWLVDTNPRYSDKITAEHLGHRLSPNPYCKECVKEKLQMEMNKALSITNPPWKHLI